MLEVINVESRLTAEEIALASAKDRLTDIENSKNEINISYNNLQAYKKKLIEDFENNGNKLKMQLQGDLGTTREEFLNQIFTNSQSLKVLL